MVDEVKDNVLIVSYFANRIGCCPAEWMDDKVDSFIKLDKKVIVISSSWSRKYKHSSVIHYRVPSLTPREYLMEYKEMRDGEFVSTSFFLWLPFVLLIGVPMHIVQILLIKGIGGGKWSWTFSSLLSAFYVLMIHKVGTVLTTGGPASAHLSGCLAAKVFRKIVVAELQDPLSGSDIGRNSKSAKMLFILEKFLVEKNDKIVYVTKKATDEAQSRFQSLRHKVFHIYPGARPFEFSEAGKIADKFVILHLGTLYSTRNFDNIIKAIDKLIEEKHISESEILLLNCGEIYGDYLADYYEKSYFKKFSLMPRREAIEFARKADVCLLVQHRDDRSLTTIPYKTYDYLNIGKPILGLIKNDELGELMTSQGHYIADVECPKEIGERVLYLFNNHKAIELAASKNSLNAVSQAESLLRV